MKNILFITHDDLSGGSCLSILNQILILRNKHFINPIVITFGKNTLYEKLLKLKIETYALKYDFTSVWTRNRLFHLIKRPYYRLFYNYMAWIKIKKMIDFGKIDLIVSNSSVIDFGAFLYRKTKIPHVWYLREFGDLDFNILPYIKDLPKYIDKNTSKIIAVSNAVAKHWISRGITKKIDVVYNGIKCDLEENKQKKTTEIIKIIMSGRFSPAKGQITAIKAVHLLPREIQKKIQLDFWGQGESEKRIISMIHKLQISDCVHVRGFSNQLTSILDEYDVGLNLSQAEAFGRTTVEYMMHGLYTICNNSGASPELLEGGKFGKLIEKNNAEKLTSAIQYYVKNRECCQKFSETGKNWVRENLNAEKNAAKAWRVYQELF